MNSENQPELNHHKQHHFCKTRPAYRQGRNLTAVKVYTISSESQHLYIYGVPSIKLRNELKTLCTKYGQVRNIHVVKDCETEAFTECYHVLFERIQSARIAKRLLDNKSFYGGVLHVCYAPEHETIEETRTKLLQRTKDVQNRIQTTATFSDKLSKLSEDTYSNVANLSKTQVRKKRKLHIIDKDDPIMQHLVPNKPASEVNTDTGIIQGSTQNGTKTTLVQYGPSISDLPITTTNNVESIYTCSNFIPNQVKKSRIDLQTKKIVFRKKS